MGWLTWSINDQKKKKNLFMNEWYASNLIPKNKSIINIFYDLIFTINWETGFESLFFFFLLMTMSLNYKTYNKIY